ncbi:pitrilysin family protein [Leifsonia sp. F6_8S_P_1B]|uniref:Pitrilysin family protein n=1 Tax=Leifsonia williamsii TaxID=3035919 RepID=A0ABT8K6E0_9MICO|nr:pitrilysin family protein [Leifsonia williamsii]MDN4613015.1 pitrilysin family protein [Leifsonia williamsii]
MSVTTLKNGMRVASVRRPGLPMDAIALNVRAGSAQEARSARGSAHCLEHLVLGKAATVRTSGLAAAMDALGAHPAAVTGKEATCFSVRLPCSDSADAIQALFHAVSTAGGFDRRVLDAEKRVILAELAGADQDAVRSALTLAESRVFAGSELEHPPIGSRADILDLSAEEIGRFWSLQYRPSAIDLGIVGPREHREVVSMVCESLGTEPSVADGCGRDDGVEALPPLRSAVAVEEGDGGAVIPVIQAFSAPAVRDRGRAVAVVLAALLGSGFGSLLVSALRAKNQLVYSPRAFYTGYGLAGCFTICAPTSRENASQVARRIRGALEAVAGRAFSQGRLEYAVRQVSCATHAAWTDQQPRLRSLLSSVQYLDRVPALSELMETVQGVSREEVAALAATMLSAEVDQLSLRAPARREAAHG